MCGAGGSRCRFRPRRCHRVREPARRRPRCGGVSPGSLPMPAPASPGSFPPRTGSCGLQEARQRGRTLLQLLLPFLLFFWPVETKCPRPPALPGHAPAVCRSRSFRIHSSASLAVAAGVFSRNARLTDPLGGLLVPGPVELCGVVVAPPFGGPCPGAATHALPDFPQSLGPVICRWVPCLHDDLGVVAASPAGQHPGYLVVHTFLPRWRE